MLNWLIPSNFQSIKTTNPYTIHPNSTLYIECSPNDPHTASNIIITAFISSVKRIIVPIRVNWTRSSSLQNLQQQESNYPMQKIYSQKSNTYMCQPSDLGCYLHAQIISLDDNIIGKADVTIGPIRIDTMLKRLIEGALFSENLLSQIVIVNDDKEKNGTIQIKSKSLELIEDQTGNKLTMEYNISEPKIQLNPKDPTKVYLRFQQDDQNTVSKYISNLFEKPIIIDRSNIQNSRSSQQQHSRNQIFKSFHCLNKIQVKFMSRHTRDLFLFVHKSFICKEMLKASAIFDKIEHISTLNTEEEYNKFLEFVSIREQVNRLVNTIHEVTKDRNKKIQDLNQLQQQIVNISQTYQNFIKSKGLEQKVDFNQSYSQISIMKQQILNRRKYRQLGQENQALKLRVRQLNEQIQLIKFFKQKQVNNSLQLNETNNPFLKKSIMQQQMGTPIHNKSHQSYAQNNHKYESPKNFIQLSKSYAKLVQQNQLLKYKLYRNNDKSKDMIELLESLGEDDDPKLLHLQKIASNLSQQNELLKNKIEMLTNQNKKNSYKYNNTSRLSSSIAHQTLQLSMSNSMLTHNQQQHTIINQSLTSQAEFKLLQEKFLQIERLNKKILEQNSRLRKQRDHYRMIVKDYKNKDRQYQEKKHKHQQQGHQENSLSTSIIIRVKQENQALVNQRNALRKKIDSLVRQNNVPIMLNSNAKPQQQHKQLEQLRIQNSKQLKQLEQLRIQNLKLKQQLEKANQKILENPDESIKLKRINIQLLEEIKNLKIELQKKMDKNLYNSRIIELEQQINYYKDQNVGKKLENVQMESMEQIIQYKKQIQRLKQNNVQQQSKLNSQSNLIERLMNQQHHHHHQVESKSNPSTGAKDNKSYSQYCKSQSCQSVEKYKKKIKQLQQQIILLRRSSDALNRSRDLSMDMEGYYDQQIGLLKKQMNLILQDNQRLSRMCEKYAKDARQLSKLKKQSLANKFQNEQEIRGQ